MASRTLITRSLLRCESVSRLVFPSTQFAGFHTNISLSEKAKSKMIGNPYFSAAPDVTAKFAPPKWKHHWLNLMKRKAEIESEVKPSRKNQLNWNYAAELRAFAHRFNIQVNGNSLKLAFTEPASNNETILENAETEPDNTAMCKIGQKFTKSFIHLYLHRIFPKMGEECLSSCINYLMSNELTSYIAKNLGYEDFIHCVEDPVQSIALTRCFYATIAAILEGPGGAVEAAKFLHDFVLTNLNDKDIVHDIWKPQDPMKILIQELTSRHMAIPEVRLTKQAGITSVLPVFFVGIFCDKTLLAESGGESIIKAETDAAKLALKIIYDVGINRYLPLVDVFLNDNFCREITKLGLERLDDKNRAMKKKITAN